LVGGLYYDWSFILTIHYYCYPHIIYKSIKLSFSIYYWDTFCSWRIYSL